MAYPTVPFFRPDLTDAEANAVLAVLTSSWLTTGPVCRAFEDNIARLTTAPRALAVSSQTMGAELILRHLGIGPGDEVIVPAYTYTATASVVLHVGAKPVMVDTCPLCPLIDPDAVARAITARTKAIIPVDLGGVMPDYDALIAMADEAKGRFQPQNERQAALGRIAIVADTAHSLGASRDGVMAGAKADFSAFSFHAVKNVTTAEGGAITWRKGLGDDEERYKTFRLMALHGQSKDALQKTCPGQWEYDIVAPYYKCNLSDVHAAIGRAQLARYDAMLARRRAITKRYDEAFSDLPVTIYRHDAPNLVSSHHLYLLHINGADETRRNALIEDVAREGVSLNVHYKPLPRLTAYRRLGYRIEDYPESDRYYQGVVTLPLFSALKDDEVTRVIEVVTHCLTQR